MIDAALDPWLRQSADRYGTPCFVYFTAPIEARIAALDHAFGGRFDLSFAVKANPNPAMLAWLAPRIPLLDISSIGEMRLALRSGWDAARLSFTGPAKRDAELAEAIAAGIGELVVESPREAVAANAIARSMGRRQAVLIRINPDAVPRGFGDQMAGSPSPFGIDVEQTAEALPLILALPHLRVRGFHIYSGTQCLRADAVVENYRTFIALFRHLAEAHGLAPDKLVFGSGLGIPYHEGDTPIDLDAVVAGITPALDALRANPRFARTRLALELGRYLVGEAGYFVTRVVSIKESRGSRIALCDGGMNNHLPASGLFGMVIRRAYKMHKVGGEGPTEKVDVTGPLCTSIDRLAGGIDLPNLEPGDLIAVHNSGAYGLTASPMHFISHQPPVEVMVDAVAIRAIPRDWAAHCQPLPARLVDHDAA
ncbi:type III PLP-dependent enzyme [Sphingomonas sp. AX6]|uniref:type III PLP-dependent enzyme n=1 Tax=Sphingomonas sp. AX6 TaxID=2653171 RepID=UPI0012F370EC|nr:type III PLP-dependent enzyme [Sphingomonas sp. AX6]VXC98574.1 Diaminopimelate decarboxylase [Sphingomonas sp. AX6]